MFICDDRFISWNLGEPCAAFAGICFSGNRLGSVAFFRKKKKKERIPFVPFVFTAYVLLLL